MDFSVVFNAESLMMFAEGAVTTAWLLLLPVVLGLALSVPLALGRAAGPWWLSRIIWLYTYTIRGTPMLLQLYLLYYGLSQFEWIRASAAWPALSSAAFCAVAAAVVNTSAYTTEMLTGAIVNTPSGEVEAARSVGMSGLTLYSRIVIPSALRRMIPAYSNEVILMLHATALASTVTLLDITSAAERLYSRFYMPFEPFIFAAFIYLMITMVLTKGFRMAESRWLAHLTIASGSRR